MSNDNYSHQPPPDPNLWGGDPTVMPRSAPSASGGAPAQPPAPGVDSSGAQQGYPQQGYPYQGQPQPGHQSADQYGQPAPDQFGGQPSQGYPPADQYGQPPADQMGGQAAQGYPPADQYGQPPADQMGGQAAQGYPSAAQPPSDLSGGPSQTYPGADQGYPPGSASAPHAPGPQQGSAPEQGYPSSGFPPHAANQPSPYGQPPAPAFQTGGGYGYQGGAPGYGQGFGGPPVKTNKNKTIALIAIPLAVVLVGISLFLIFRDPDDPVAVPSPTASATAGPTASEEPAPSTSTSEAPTKDADGPTAKAPGPGTTTAALEYLESKGFKCTDEGNKAVVSKLCSHFDKAPGMLAYVGGRPDGSLGRLSVEIQTENTNATTKEVSTWVIEQFVGKGDAATAIAAGIKKGAPGKWAKGSEGDVRYRGNNLGSVVLWVDDWYPSDLKPAVINTSVAKFSQYVITRGYACKSASAVGDLKCTREANGNTFTIYMRADEDDEGIESAYVTVERENPDSQLPGWVKSETTMFLNGLGGQASAWKTYIYDADPTTGDTQFVGGMVADWYPGAVSEATSGGLYLQPPCWWGTRTAC